MNVCVCGLEVLGLPNAIRFFETWEEITEVRGFPSWDSDRLALISPTTEPFIIQEKSSYAGQP